MQWVKDRYASGLERGVIAPPTMADAPLSHTVISLICKDDMRHYNGLTVHVCRWTGGSAGGCRAGSTRPFRLSPPSLLAPPFLLKVHGWRLLVRLLLGRVARGMRGAVPLRTVGRPSLLLPQPPPDAVKGRAPSPTAYLSMSVGIESVIKRRSFHLGDKVADLGCPTTHVPLRGAAMASRTAHRPAWNQ